ncbi:MAG: ABC transporter permease [Lachnospiraceae bacterium]|nr:ABC transporter permease [Lachnospiraceae bacterium]
MLKYIGKRLLMMIPTLIGITIVVQLLLYIVPGDPVVIMLGSRATPELVEETREELGLNDPVYVQYFRYVGKVLHGDFGSSLITKRPVTDEIVQRFPYTLFLVTLVMALAVVLGVPLGVFAAIHHNTWKDNIAMFFALFCVAMPSFWFALLLVQFFGVNLRVLPLDGVSSWKSWVMPVVSLALCNVALIARQTRSNVLETIRQDYITTARAKGCSEGKVIYYHCLKNALIPVITVVGGVFGVLLGGVLVTEVIFSIPGMGQYTLTALMSRDYPVIQSSVLILSTVFSIVILIVDIVYALIDPRIRSQFTGGKAKKSKQAALPVSEPESSEATE